MVGHEEGIELSGFEFLDQTLEMGEIEIGVRPCAGIAPGAGMNTDRPHERAKPQLTFCHDLIPAIVIPGSRFARPGKTNTIPPKYPCAFCRRRNGKTAPPHRG